MSWFFTINTITQYYAWKLVQLFHRNDSWSQLSPHILDDKRNRKKKVKSMRKIEAFEIHTIKPWSPKLGKTTQAVYMTFSPSWLHMTCSASFSGLPERSRASTRAACGVQRWAWAPNVPCSPASLKGFQRLKKLGLPGMVGW